MKYSCLSKFRIADDQGPAEQIAVAAEVLGGRVHDDIGAEFQRPRQHRGGKRVVDAQQRAVPVGQLGTGRDVGDRHARIAGTLDPDQLRLRREVRGERRPGCVLSASVTRMPDRLMILWSSR